MFRSLQEPLKMDGSLKSDRPLKQCSTPGCGLKDPAGGIELSPTRWVCRTCWRARNAKKKP